jgi:uncharacterized ferritin-like protein (DUF455 family)
MDLRQRALEALLERDPASKAAAARALHDEAMHERCPLDPAVIHTTAATLPGRPERPALVAPGLVPRRSPHTLEGRAALLHAVAHIEFNAINLALDAVWRFAGLPAAYYRDWLRVAAEEAHHYSLLAEHLGTLGHRYGDFDAHDGLWAMCEKTRDDLLARMALVPRTLEARGLDATPPMQRKLARAGDTRAVAILDVILADEIGHVAIGNRWYRWVCEGRGVDPVVQYETLLQQYGAPRLRPPFNLSARRRAGFDERELSALGLRTGRSEGD